jgi:hypothetical protein
MRTRLVEAYLGHRLNNHELVDVMRRSQAGDQSALDTFNTYSDRQTDWRGEVASDQVNQAQEQLGLKEQFANLDDGKVWTAQDRAVYRRLSQPDHDPATQGPSDAPAVLDSRLAQTLGASFSSWDRDGNIRLERQELDYLMSGGFYGEKLDVANDPQRAAALATVARFHDLLSSGNPADGEGVSQADIIFWSESSSGHAPMQAVNETYQEYLQRAHESSSRPLAEEDIVPDHLTQGVIGSCVLLSSLLGTEVNTLVSMMLAKEDGTYEVRFPDGAKETVREPSLAERLFHSHGANGDRWPAVIEIAAAQRLIGQGQRADDGLRGVIEGIDPEFAIPAMTGRAADKRSLDELTPEQTRDLLQEAMASGGPVICGSRPTASGDFINVEELHNGIANGHCYAIKGFDPATGTVELRNPWHKGEWEHGSDPTDDGAFEMPLRDFYASFRWVTFAKTAS